MAYERFFETIRIENGHVCNISYHQNRFTRTSELDFDLLSFINPPKEGIYRCKVIYDKKQISDVIYYRYKQRKIASLKPVRIDFSYEKKYLERSMIDRVFEQRGECDEILMCRGTLICDTSIANVAFYDGRDWFTPKKPLLYGTTRERYIETGKLTEADIEIDSIKEFSHIAFMNAMIDFDIMSIEKIEKDIIRVDKYNERL